MKYHKRFNNIDQRVVKATKDLIRGWSTIPADDTTEKWLRLDKWVGEASAVYGMQRPIIAMTQSIDDYGHYRLDSNEIHLPYPSIITVLHEFRHAMQNQNVRGAGRLWDVEDDARAWSLSLYYKVAPRTFRRLVREGKVLHMTEDDLTNA